MIETEYTVKYMERAGIDPQKESPITSEFSHIMNKALFESFLKWLGTTCQRMRHSDILICLQNITVPDGVLFMKKIEYKKGRLHGVKAAPLLNLWLVITYTSYVTRIVFEGGFLRWQRRKKQSKVRCSGYLFMPESINILPLHPGFLLR